MTKTIIISDDHPLSRQALLAAIQPLFRTADILEAETLAATLEVLEHRQVDLLLLDLRMSDSGGLAGLTIIKCSHPEVPVIVVSASEGAETVRAAIQSGASGYIVKSHPPDRSGAPWNRCFREKSRSRCPRPRRCPKRNESCSMPSRTSPC